MRDSIGIKLGSQLSPRGAVSARNMTSHVAFEETMRDEVIL